MSNDKVEHPLCDGCGKRAAEAFCAVLFTPKHTATLYMCGECENAHDIMDAFEEVLYRLGVKR